MTGSGFSHGPDPELGAALRRALDAPGEAAFVTRVHAALAGGDPRPRTWDVLAAWARRGMIAAAAAALLAGLLVARAEDRPAAVELDEAFAAAVSAGGAPAELALNTPPDPSVALATSERP